MTATAIPLRMSDRSNDARQEQLRPAVTYPRDAVLEIEHVAHACSVSVSTIERADLPCFYLGNRRRYLWGQVLDELARRAIA